MKHHFQRNSQEWRVKEVENRRFGQYLDSERHRKDFQSGYQRKIINIGTSLVQQTDGDLAAKVNRLGEVG